MFSKPKLSELFLPLLHAPEIAKIITLLVLWDDWKHPSITTILSLSLVIIVGAFEEKIANTFKLLLEHSLKSDRRTMLLEGDYVFRP